MLRESTVKDFKMTFSPISSEHERLFFALFADRSRLEVKPFRSDSVAAKPRCCFDAALPSLWPLCVCYEPVGLP